MQCQRVSRDYASDQFRRRRKVSQTDEFLVEDSIPLLYLPSFSVLPLGTTGWNTGWLFLFFDHRCDQGKWGLRFRIKAHSGPIAITLEISSRSRWIDRFELRHNEILRECHIYLLLSISDAAILTG